MTWQRSMASGSVKGIVKQNSSADSVNSSAGSSVDRRNNKGRVPMRKAKVAVSGLESMVSADIVRSLNDKVYAAAAGYSVGYKTHPEAHTIYVVLDSSKALGESKAAYIIHDYVVTLGLADRARCSKAVLWALAHELAHCYLGPDMGNANIQSIVALWPHDKRSWEKVADDIASQVVDYDRRRWNKRRRA